MRNIIVLCLTLAATPASALDINSFRARDGGAPPE
jgi:hypothetical protein